MSRKAAVPAASQPVSDWGRLSAATRLVLQQGKGVPEGSVNVGVRVNGSY